MKTFFKIILVGVLIGLGVKLFVVESFTVPTDSMVPTLAVGQRVWLNKLPFHPKKGDVIGFEKNEEYFVKRIVGMPSDLVITEGGRYQIFQNKRLASDTQMSLLKIPKRGDAVQLDETNYAFYQPLIEKEGNQIGKVINKVFINGLETTNYSFKQDYYFVQGDNTGNSIDSRQFGLISEKSILGRVIL